jgi:cyclase
MANAVSGGPNGGHADAALAATIFHYGEFTIAETKRVLAAQQLPTRGTTG